MEEMQRTRYGERARSFLASLRSPFFPDFQMFANPEALQTSSFWVFMEASCIGVTD